MTEKTNGPFTSFAAFYPYYLDEHRDLRCRLMHFIGSTLVIALLILSVVTQHWMLLWCLPVAGYGFAWLGHFAFEHNKPATFRYPFYSLMGDWVMNHPRQYATSILTNHTTHLY